MDAEHKDYAYKNEISLSIGDDSVDSTTSTPSTITPPAHPTPSPRQNINEDTKPLTKKSVEMSKPEGIDNKAFEATEKSSGKPLSSFGNGHSNGLNDSATNSANKNGQINEKKLAEAVNLELININSNNNNAKKPTATNGKHNNNNDLPVKKDGGDVEMGTNKNDSYDEYFVPVNEHRKYMSLSKPRKLHGVDRNGLSIESPEYGIVNYNEWIDNVSRGEKLYVTKDKRANPNKNRLCWILCIGLVAIVILLGILAALPNTLEGQITLSNAEYSNEYNDPNSPIYKKLIKDLEYELKNALSENGNEEFFIKIIGLKSGSVVVDYRVSWKNPNSELSAEDMSMRIQNFLQRNNQLFMSRYLVNKNTIRTARVPDRCAAEDRNECDEGCIFDAELVDFMCTCPKGFKFDDDFKECVNDYDSIYVSPPTNSEEPSEELKAEPEPSGEPKSHDHDHDHDHHHYHHHSGTDSAPEPSGEPKSEPEPTTNSNYDSTSVHQDHVHHHIHVFGSQDSEPTSEPKSEPEPTSEPKSEPEPTSEPKADDEHHHVHVLTDSKSEPEATSEPKSEPEPSSEPKSEPEPTSEPKADDDLHDHIHVHVSNDSKSEPEATSEPKSEPEPTSEPKSKPEATSEPKAEPEPTGEPKSDDDYHHVHVHVSTELKSEQEATSEPKSEPEATSEPKSEPEPTGEPKSDDDHHHVHVHVSTELKSEQEATSEPKSEPEATSEPKSEPEPTSEPKSEPEPTSEPKSDDDRHHIHVHVSTDSKSEPEATSEPKSEPEPSSEPVSEPEPTAEPKADDHHDHIHVHVSTDSKSEPEATSEPKSELEPSSEPDSDSKATITNTTNENSSVFIYNGDKKSKLLEEEQERVDESSARSKPVIEEVEDTPRPTENYFSVSRSKDLKNDVNVFDMNSTVQSSSQNNGTVYSTSTPIQLWTTENTTQAEPETHDMSPFLPIVENVNQKMNEKIYSVTENVSEVETPHNQSPFLPEIENNETLHHILNGAHGMIMSEESTEDANKTFSITVSYSNESHTDSPIIKVVPLTTTVIPVESTTAASSSSTQLPILLDVTATESSSTTTTEKTDEEVEKEEEENQNLFGEEVEVENENDEKETTSEIPIAVMNETTTSESQLTTNLSESSDSLSPIAVESSTTPVPSTTTEMLQTTSSLDSSSSTTTNSLIKSVAEFILGPNEKFQTISEPLTTTTAASEATSSTMKEDSTVETSTSLNNDDGIIDDIISRITLNDFKQFEDNNLKVLPLTTTTEANLLTSENEITEKTETTGHFLEQTTFPSTSSDSTETSATRNAKILPDNYFKNTTEEKKTQQSLADNIEDKIKLFKEGFLQKLDNGFDKLLCSDGKFKCELGNECISLFKVCDGKAQCSDHSDEWNCFNVINNTNILQVKKEDKYFKVCATSWTGDLSNKVCNKLGYSGADGWKNNRDAATNDDKYLIAKSGGLEDLEFVESCNDGLVEIECTNYECGANSTSNADSGEFASIALVVNRDSSLRCTASIISPLWAMTSADCVSKPDQEWILIAGSTELNMSKISKNSVISLIGNIVTYPESDFALLELKQVLTFTNQIYSACLNEKRVDMSKECLTTGWLITESNNAYEKYEKIVSVEHNCTAPSDDICVSHQNRLSSECFNDKGAALYCYSSYHRRWLLNGIQNKQSDCQDTTKPSIFANLSSKIMKWIQNTVGNSRMFA
ncbi:CLUMA_CG013129, isoform A [Clunio marinus]|uniref:CLUMA_CG013129, isoform A n=1 Tax=Clunio marinus TaxID=568069 RepID=A0A1J1IHU5_9DIPT|nr:CLUMA_CG013129, isoform A [Clunio marinus]